jgi:hypothetical protein
MVICSILSVFVSAVDSTAEEVNTTPINMEEIPRESLENFKKLIPC